MSEENLQTGGSDIDTSQEIAAAESGLEAALASIKQNDIKSSFETQEEDIQPQTEVRETLKLKERSEPVEQKKFVETNDPAVQKRIDELYRESKVATERNSLLQDELRKIADATEQREYYYANKIAEIEGRYTKQDEEGALTGLRNQYREAIENFDYDNASKINEKIVDFKTEQKLNAIIRDRNLAENNQRQIEKNKKPVPYSDPQDEADAVKFTNEVGDDGSLARPWLQPNHPQFQDVIDVMAAVSNGFIRKNQKPSLSAVMQKVDEWMGKGIQKNASREAESTLKHPPVLSSNTTLNASSDNQANKISDLERTYAAKLGVSEKDYTRIRKYSSSGPISMDTFKK